MTTVTFRVSEEEFVTANAIAFREVAWVRWVIWTTGAVVLLALVYAAIQLALGREGLGWDPAKYVAAAGAVGAWAAYKRRWGYARTVRGHYRRAPHAGGEITAVWSDDRITLSDAVSSQSHAWRDVRGWKDAGAVLAIWMRDGTVIVAPRRALTQAELDDLRAKLGRATA